MRTNLAGGTSAGTLIVAAAAFLFVIGVGAAISYVGDSPETSNSGGAISFSLSPSESNAEMLARITAYTHSNEAEESASTAATGALLPDVNTMTDRLAARLETAPEDVEGWTLLMRSRLVLGEKEVAAAAFRKALEVFKNDSTASGKITAAAIELGLKAE
jgi:cytochrome c-type biogenesis protein CcmH